MLKLVTIYYILITLVFAVNFKIYNIPGKYIVNPVDYNFTDKIIVELWGGGASGSNCVTNNIICDPNHSKYFSIANYETCYGGGAGAYIKANIFTYNSSFILNVGKGGIGKNCAVSGYETCTYNSIINGTDTSINNNFINLTAGGGYSKKYNKDLKYMITSFDMGGIVKNLKIKNIDKILHIQNGSILVNPLRYVYINYPTAIINGAGCGGNGYGAYGGGGGEFYGINSNTDICGDCILTRTCNNNGKTPGGGGASVYCGLLKTPGNGGNGTIIIYF